MRQLHIQIQLARSLQLHVDEALARLSHLTEGACVTKEENGRYINIDYKTLELLKLWELVKDELRLVSGLAESTIVVCQGQHGWDDYLLLHHFDPTQPLDLVK